MHPELLRALAKARHEDLLDERRTRRQPRVWAAYSERQAPSEWQNLRNRLSVLMVGLTEELLKCADVRNANSRQDAVGKAGAARGEADNAIARVHAAMAELSDE